MNERANPFANLSSDLPDFPTKPRSQPVAPEIIEKVAAEHGFPSRQAAPAAQPKKTRAITRRKFMPAALETDQLNLRVTLANKERFYTLLQQLMEREGRKISNGELLSRALSALEEKEGIGSKSV